MDKQKFSEYLKNRYYVQVEWYDKKANLNEKMYRLLQTVVMALAVTTPILLIIQEEPLRWLAIISSGTVAVAATLLRAFNYQENWINYRTTCETLRKEIHYHDARLFGYNDAKDPEALFVERVETLISREHSLWIVSKKLEEPEVVS